MTAQELSARQRDIVVRVANGETTKAIASDLSLSQKTVEYHLAKIRSRVGARSLAGLVRWAIRAGLIEA